MSTVFSSREEEPKQAAPAPRVQRALSRAVTDLALVAVGSLTVLAIFGVVWLIAIVGTAIVKVFTG